MSSPIITYGDIPLAIPDKDILDWVDATIPFNASNYFRTLNAGYIDEMQIYFKNYSENPFDRIKLNSLFWPTGASRFSMGFYLTTSENLEKLPYFDAYGIGDSEDKVGGIRAQVNGDPVDYNPLRSDGYKPLNLRLENTGVEFSAKMWMLPPRPLMQIYEYPDASGDLLKGHFPVSHLEALWVIPLVDDRYWWWWHTTGKMSMASCATWESTFQTLFEKMGYAPHQLQIDAVDADYLYPHSKFRKQDYIKKVPLVLDTMAHCINARVFTDYSGKVHVRSAEESFKILKAASPTPAGSSGGGRLNLASLRKKDIKYNFSELSNFFTQPDTKVNETAQILRDTGGVIPEYLTFVVNNGFYRVNMHSRGEDAATRLSNPLSSSGYDTLISQRFETINSDGTKLDGKLRFFTPTGTNITPPTISNEEKVVSGSEQKQTINFKNGDYLYDLKNELIYGPKNNASWGIAKKGQSILTKLFNITASSYKANKKTCPSTALPATGQSEVDFNKQQFTNFTKRYAIDWALYQLSDVDYMVNGCVPIPLHGMLDHIITYMSVDESYTRVVRPPYNDLTEEVYIESYLGDEAACASDTYPCGQCKGIAGRSLTNPVSTGGAGYPEGLLPYAPHGIVQNPPNNSLREPTAKGQKGNYPNWHAPPYVVKYCLGSSIGTVALDFQTTLGVSIKVYWNGQIVGSRETYGTYNALQQCNVCGKAYGRITFAKTEKTPSYAFVIIDALPNQTVDDPYDTDWVINMRCVDSAPYPAPRCLACDANLNQFGGVFTLGMFTSMPMSIPGNDGGGITSTPLCTGKSAASTFACGSNANCEIPGNLLLKFIDVPDSCIFLKDVEVKLQQSASQGGWIGVFDGFGFTQEIVQFHLRTSGTSVFTLYLKDIVNASRPVVSTSSRVSCNCIPFELVLQNLDLSSYSCAQSSGTPFKVSITEA